MVSLMLLFNALIPFFTSSLFPVPFIIPIAKSEVVQLPSFAFSWLNNNETFMAGDIATIEVKVLGNYEAEKYKYPFNPNFTVNDKMGNSSYISGVSSYFDGDVNSWRISFIPIVVGLFNVLLIDDHFKVLDSSLHFRVIPGLMYPSAGIVSWIGGMNEFVAGTKVTVLMLPKDAFGNNISSTSERSNFYNFTLSAYFANGSIATLLNVTNKGWNQFGYLSIEFSVATAGSLFLHVHEENQTLIGSPLPFKVKPGALDVSNCVVQWNIETKSFQLFSVMEASIHQQDQYGNLVPGLYSFDVEVIEKWTNLSMPIADLCFKEVDPGIQMFSFSLDEPGNFMLMISDKELKNLISNVPHDFTVYIGYSDGFTSIINGSGLNNSVAGEVARFSVFLKDAYLYPSPVELERLQVEIVREFDSRPIHPIIYPLENVNGSQSAGKLNYGAISDMDLDSAPIVSPNNISKGSQKVKASDFNVVYMPEQSGIYEIRVFCGNIPLNGGHPFKKEVSAGDVNMSLSGAVKFSPKVPKLIKNEVVVELLDSFSNPVLSQQSRLKLEIGSINKSGFSTWMFVDNKDGSYTGSYLAKDVGTYEICASFDGKRFLPCPFGVNVYSSEYFPKTYNDTISVWEDESIAFNTLENDYFAGVNASIVDYSKPSHGSLLQYGDLFRYTPYKGFYGNDSFSYIISDVNGNLASGNVNISVLSIPPQFISIPRHLQATEDVIGPRFGGFSGFEMMYSDLVENISVTLNALSGTVFLSPMLMQFWQPMWSELSVQKGDGKAKDLIIVGRLEVINFALQSIQYIGNENFCGDDTIRVTAMNSNGVNDLDVPIFVDPINDPPFIDVPAFIFLAKKDDEEVLIFDRQKDKFNFIIGDPDLLNFPGSHFSVMFSVEVNSGFLSTNLPAELISTTELKLKSSYQWQPLQTFVTISKHFMVKAKGIRFRGTVNGCNSVLQQLSYHGGEHGAVLTVSINDLGNYGCYPDCSEMMSVPLIAEATVNLIRKRPLSSLVAHTLGSAIVIEFIMVFSLGAILLFFICKCAFVLIREKKKHELQDVKLSTIKDYDNQRSKTDFSEDASDFTGCCSSPFLLGGFPSKFCQKPSRQPRNGASGNDTSSFQSSGDHHQNTPLAGLMPAASGKGQSGTV